MNTRVEINEEKAKEINEEKNRQRNKKILKILAWIFIPLFIIFTVSYISLRYIGNIGIVVREYPIYGVPKDFDGVKIVQFSDIHYNDFLSKDKLEEMVSKINRTNPDIVIFTGDLIDSNYNLLESDKEFFIDLLNRISSTMGKYAIKGEDDFEDFENIMSNAGFEILSTNTKIYKNESSIDLIVLEGNEKIPTAISNYSIVITHKPDSIDSIIDELKPNLVLAGHSHNGQVRLPIIGPVMKRIGSKKYIDSYYKINDTELIISGGIGNVKYNFRLFNHPSINFLRLKSKSNK